MTTTQFVARLKTLANSLRDVGHPVSEPSQVLNQVRSLHPRYRYVIPSLTNRTPPHTFMSARSALLLEELRDVQYAKQEATQAVVASHGSPSSSGFGSNSDSPKNNSGGSNSSKSKDKRRRGRGSNNSGSGRQGSAGNGGSGHNQSLQPHTSVLPSWVSGYNSWTRLFQARPMPFRASAAAGHDGYRAVGLQRLHTAKRHCLGSVRGIFSFLY